MDKKWYLYSYCNSSLDSISNFQNCRSTITLTFIVVYPLTSIDDYSDIQCHLSIDFDRRLLWHSVSFFHWLWLSMSSIVNVVNDHRQPFSFVVVRQCRKLLWHSLSFIHWLRSTITLTFSVIYPLTSIVNVFDRQCRSLWIINDHCRPSSWSSLIVVDRRW